MNNYLLTKYNFDIRRWIERDNIRSWMDYRFDIFRRFIAPSVNGQIEKPKKWFIILDPITLDKDVDKIQGCSNLIEIIRMDEPYDYLRKRLSILERNRAFAVASIDSDDAIEKDYFKLISSSVIRSEESYIIDLNFWIRIDLEFKECQWIFNCVRRNSNKMYRSKSPIIVQFAKNYIFLPNIDACHVQLGKKIPKYITMDATLLQFKHHKNFSIEFIPQDPRLLFDHTPIQEVSRALKDWIYDRFSFEQL